MTEVVHVDGHGGRQNSLTTASDTGVSLPLSPEEGTIGRGLPPGAGTCDPVLADFKKRIFSSVGLP